MDPLEPLKRGQKSQIIVKGRRSYGIVNIKIKSWNEGAHLFIGSFCSIANNQIVFLGGNHRSDWCTTFPFGSIFKEEYPAGKVNGRGHPASKGHVVIENDVSAAVMGVVHWLDAPHLQLLSVGTTAKCLPLFRHVTAQESFPLRDACV